MTRLFPSGLAALALIALASTSVGQQATEGADIDDENLDYVEATPEEEAGLSGETSRTMDQVLQPYNFGSEYLSAYGYIQPAFVYTEDVLTGEEATVLASRDNDDLPQTGDRFTFGNVRIGFQSSYPVNDMISVGLNAELSYSAASNLLRPKDLYGSFGFWGDRIKIDVGQQRVAFSLYRQTSARFQQIANPTSDQPSALGLILSREPGLRVRLETPLPGDGALMLHLSVSNGEGENAFEIDERNAFRYSAFLDVAPLGDPGLDPADLNDSDFVFSIGGSASYSAGVANPSPGAAEGGPDRRLAAHARFKFKGLSFRTEYLHARRDAQTDSGDVLSRGAVLQAGYVLPWLDFPQLELAIRYQRFDLDNSRSGFEGGDGMNAFEGLTLNAMETQFVEAGVNLFFLDHRAKLSVAYRFTDIVDDKLIGTSEEFGRRLVGNRLFVVLQFGAF